jgi:hypothetical protein
LLVDLGDDGADDVPGIQEALATSLHAGRIPLVKLARRTLLHASLEARRLDGLPPSQELSYITGSWEYLCQDGHKVGGKAVAHVEWCRRLLGCRLLRCVPLSKVQVQCGHGLALKVHYVI